MVGRFSELKTETDMHVDKVAELNDETEDIGPGLE